MKRPTERNFEGITTYDTFEWKTPPTRFDELPQFTDVILKPARALIVENDLWLEPYPNVGHEFYWDREVSQHYDYEWDTAPGNIIVLRIPRSGELVINRPYLGDADDTDILRVAHVLDLLQVDPKTPVQWDLGIVTDNGYAHEYNALIR